MTAAVVYPFQGKTLVQMTAVFEAHVRLVDDTVALLERSGPFTAAATARHSMALTLAELDLATILLAVRAHFDHLPVANTALILAAPVRVTLTDHAGLNALSVRLNKLAPQVEAMGRVVAGMREQPNAVAVTA